MIIFLMNNSLQSEYKTHGLMEFVMTPNLAKDHTGLSHLVMIMKVVKSKLNDQGRSLKEMVGYVDSSFKPSLLRLVRI